MVTRTFKKEDGLFLWSILKKKKKERKKGREGKGKKLGKNLQGEGKIGRECFWGLDADLEGERAKWYLKKDKCHLQVGRVRGIEWKVRAMGEGK